jgi:hypothetical protein
MDGFANVTDACTIACTVAEAAVAIIGTKHIVNRCYNDDRA